MNNTDRRIGLSLALLLVVLSLVSACQPAGNAQEESRPQAAPAQTALKATAAKVAEGVGEVRQVSGGGSRGTVFLFEEFHTSRVGQLQIAIMLARLHDRHGTKRIGLEGALQSPRALNASWFHAVGTPGHREDVALRMLSEGEINAAEFLTLIHPDVEVHGLELKEEYDVELDVEGHPAFTYLIGIAETYLPQSDIGRINDLLTEQREKEALEIIKNADPWVHSSFESLEDKVTSAEEELQLMHDIQKKADDRGVVIEQAVRDEMQEVMLFFDMADQRSRTMSNRMASLIGTDEGAPSAMIIGAAHTKRTMEILNARQLSVALLRPLAFNPDYANLSMEQFQRKNRRMWAQVSEGSLGRLLNSPRKPQPMIERATAKSYANAHLAALVIAEAARDGKKVPADVRQQLEGLPDLRIDWQSFDHDGFDTIFRIWVIDTGDQEREVWVRAGTSDSVEGSRNLEEKLLQGIADLGGGGRVPPRKPPANSDGTKDEEGPGDGKRGKVVIRRVSQRSLAVFAESRAQAVEVGRVSG